MFLLDDILLAPIRGVTWVAEKCRDLAESELYDPDKIREELLALQARADMGEIGEEEYRAKEKDLLDRLSEGRERREGGGEAEGGGHAGNP